MSLLFQIPRYGSRERFSAPTVIGSVDDHERISQIYFFVMSLSLISIFIVNVIGFVFAVWAVFAVLGHVFGFENQQSVLAGFTLIVGFVSAVVFRLTQGPEPINILDQLAQTGYDYLCRDCRISQHCKNDGILNILR